MNIKKILVSMLLVILIFFSFAQVQVKATNNEIDVEKVIDKDEGGLFEKIIAKIIRRISRNSIQFNNK
ncbi:MAG: hypothetical protein HFJ30_08000 [Clostridia bacterium]|nr:hypothetical protein [Clostridia bacterium]